ncbi:MAG: hypothetical protein LQ338_001692 [Usnochroma carphineum]|nr:MAG: hypothetical protein LQ338_001692 [Usnochroma carphineum]
MLARGTLSTRVRTMDIRHLDPAMAHPSKEPPPWAFPASSGTLLPPQTTPARDTDEYARPQNPGENPPPPQIPHPTATPPVDPTSSCTHTPEPMIQLPTTLVFPRLETLGYLSWRWCLRTANETVVGAHLLLQRLKRTLYYCDEIKDDCMGPRAAGN